MLVLHGRSSRDHPQVSGFQSAQLSNQLIGETVAQIVFFRLPTQVFKRQYGQLDLSAGLMSRPDPRSGQVSDSCQKNRKANKHRNKP